MKQINLLLSLKKITFFFLFLNIIFKQVFSNITNLDSESEKIENSFSSLQKEETESSNISICSEETESLPSSSEEIREDQEQVWKNILSNAKDIRAKTKQEERKTNESQQNSSSFQEEVQTPSSSFTQEEETNQSQSLSNGAMENVFNKASFLYERTINYAKEGVNKGKEIIQKGSEELKKQDMKVIGSVSLFAVTPICFILWNEFQKSQKRKLKNTENE